MRIGTKVTITGVQNKEALDHVGREGKIIKKMEDKYLVEYETEFGKNVCLTREGNFVVHEKKARRTNG